MKSDINVALKARMDDAGLPYAHTATNVELLRVLLDDAGVGYSFLEREGELIAKLVSIEDEVRVGA